MDHHREDDHDLGLSHGMGVIAERLMGRGRALAFLAHAETGAETVVTVVACGGDASGSTSATSSSTSSAPFGSGGTGRTASLISRLAMPAATDTAVPTGDSRYAASIANCNAITLSSGTVFGDNTSAQIARMTPSLTGTVTSGHTGSVLIGIAA